MNEDEEFAGRPIRAFAGIVHSEKTHGREAKIGTRPLDRFTTLDQHMEGALISTAAEAGS